MTTARAIYEAIWANRRNRYWADVRIMGVAPTVIDERTPEPRVRSIVVRL